MKYFFFLAKFEVHFGNFSNGSANGSTIKAADKLSFIIKFVWIETLQT